MSLTDNEIIKALDGADLFLRNRATSKPAPLNQYDINELLDIAKVCDEAANLINRQKAEIERLKAMHSEICIGMKVLKRNAIKEFWDKLKDGASYCFTSTGGKEICATRVYSIKAIDGDNLVKEMVGE